MKIDEEPENYAGLVKVSTLSYIATVGVVVAVILTITGLIAFTVLRHGQLVLSILDALTYVFAPMMILVAIYSYYRAGRTYRGALEFYELAVKIAEAIGVSNGELLEKPAPPYIVIYRRSRRYIVVRKEDGITVVNLLEPVKINHEEGYAPVYMWKTREVLMYKNIEGYRAAWIKLWALFPDPQTGSIVHGEFTAYTVRVPSRHEEILKIIKALIEKQPGSEGIVTK